MAEKKSRKEKLATRAERMRRYRARKKNAGLVQTLVWIPEGFALAMGDKKRIGIIVADDGVDVPVQCWILKTDRKFYPLQPVPTQGRLPTAEGGHLG